MQIHDRKKGLVSSKRELELELREFRKNENITSIIIHSWKAYLLKNFTFSETSKTRSCTQKIMLIIKKNFDLWPKV
jgi:hypothetical protein